MRSQLARQLFVLEMALRRRIRALRNFLLLNPCLAAAALAAAGMGWAGAPERPSGAVDLGRTAQVRGLVVSRPQLRRGRLTFLLQPRHFEQGGRRTEYPHLIQVSLPWMPSDGSAGRQGGSGSGTPQSSAAPQWGPVAEGGLGMPRIGDRLAFNAFLRDPTYFATPGAPDFRRILYLKGILHQVYLKSPLQLQRQPPAPVPLHLRPWRALQHAVAAYGDKRRDQFDPRAWKILAGVCLGLRPDWTDAEWMRLQRLGLVHLFVVSGLHVSMLLALFHHLLRRIKILPPGTGDLQRQRLGRLRQWLRTERVHKLLVRRIPAAAPAAKCGEPARPALFAEPAGPSPAGWIGPGLRALLTLTLLWCYVLLSGTGVPALRAAVMGSLFYLLWSAGLQRQPLNALGLAGLLVLLAQPAAIFQSGFQFSFLSLAAIGLFYLPRARLIDQACRGCGDLGETRLRVRRTPSQRLRRRVRFALEQRLAFADPEIIRRPLAWLTVLLRWAVPLAAVSFFIQITTLPLALEQSNRWLWTQAAANLLLTPVISLMLPLGLLDLLLWPVPWLGQLSGWTVEAWGIASYRLMEGAEPWTASVFLPHPRTQEIAVYFVLLLVPHLLLGGRARWMGYCAAPLLLYAWLSLSLMSMLDEVRLPPGDQESSGSGLGAPASGSSVTPPLADPAPVNAAQTVVQSVGGQDVERVAQLDDLPRAVAAGEKREEVGRLSASQDRRWLHVTLLDVGQGESIHIAYPGGASAMVDSGGSWRSQGAFDFIGWKVTARYLWNVRSPPLRYLMLSHGDSDHAGAFAVIERLFQPESVLLSWPHAALLPREEGAAGKGRSRESQARTSQGSSRAGGPAPRSSEDASAGGAGYSATPLQTADTFLIDDIRHRILHPPGRGTASDNNNSLVMLMKHGHCSILLTGDIEGSAENRLLDDLGPVTVLKVAHHGAAGSTSAQFLDRVRPRLALISAGRNSRFGHPAPATIRRLEEQGIDWRVTSTAGSLRWSADGKRWMLAAYSVETGSFSIVAHGPCRPAERPPQDES